MMTFEAGVEFPSGMTIWKDVLDPDTVFTSTVATSLASSLGVNHYQMRMGDATVDVELMRTYPTSPKFITTPVISDTRTTYPCVRFSFERPTCTPVKHLDQQ